MTAAQRQSGFLAPDDPPSPKYTGKTGDTTMKFTLFWKHPGAKDSSAIGETHEQLTTDPVQWSKDLLDWFNRTLRPHERKRVFVRCEIVGEVPPAEHRWVKHSAMTKVMSGGPRHGQIYDAMECERCGVTGKRYGLGPAVKLDHKFKATAFKRCDTSMQQQGKYQP